MKENCWEFKKCGREEGGKNSVIMGVCPASAAKNHDGRNDGKNAGRHCWKVAGTFCDGTVQGTWAMKMKSCSQCDFFKHVMRQEGPKMVF